MRGWNRGRKARPPAGEQANAEVIRAYGPGPAGVTCGTCARFTQDGAAGAFNVTGRCPLSTASWRKYFTACGRYQAPGAARPA